jgi:DNA-binding beta-propeller fold protein YncE
MVDTLHCPSCGAPLDYDEQSESKTMRCPFCDNVVMLPERQRPAVQQQVVVKWKSSGNKNAVTAGVIVAFVAVFVTGGVALFAYHQITKTTADVKRAVSIPTTKNTLAPSSSDAWAGYTQPDMAFGSDGIGPGHFKDARSIAVDAEGRIYVGEYSGGRVQVFDSSGKFVTQWMVDPKMPLRGMAADRKGTVYVVQKGDITRYEGASGKSLGTMGSGRFDDVAATADGGLVAFSYQARDDIVRLDSTGQVTKIIRAAISGQTERSELNMRVAADGVGNIYALGAFNDAVFKFTADGRFVTQFGGKGDEPGQFTAPSAIAVDNQGRVYVSDFKGVQVFDANGRYLGLIKVKGAASGLTFNDRNELFVVARTQVYKFAPFKP